MDVLRFLVVLVAITLTNSRSLADSNEHKSRVVDRVSTSIYEYWNSCQL